MDIRPAPEHEITLDNLLDRINYLTEIIRRLETTIVCMEEEDFPDIELRLRKLEGK